MKTVFSGVQPTNKLTIGNYLGAMKNWVDYHKDYRAIFSVVDLHSLTSKISPEERKRNSFEIVTLYIALGLDPAKNIIYYQSDVKEHSELAWILNCYAYMGELSRMTQFKDKSTGQENVNLGLFAYPVLMASDILLYQTNIVPVGEDQTQHLELTRDIAIRFNNLYGDIFQIPEKLTPKLTARIKGLQNPEKKMSKSSEEPNDSVFILDSPELITKKIKRAVTDSEGSVYYDVEKKPGVSNLLTIYAGVTKKTIEEATKDFEGANYGTFKKIVCEALIEDLSPIQKEFEKLIKDEAYIKEVLIKNSEKASAIAKETIYKVKEAVGLPVR
ncbi:MAG: tryptophan--tRNA ligase [Defluviitaleaceae bacterium]|nr:tryptophan--tRNA ligase [Defluviitaleaceae bacterium]